MQSWRRPAWERKTRPEIGAILLLAAAP